MQRLIEQYPLQRGSHPSRDDGMCAMEMVAWLAGEAHSDEPQCACPVLAAMVRACNDVMSDEARNQHLRPLVPQLVHSRRTAAVERARGLIAIDFMVRGLLPRWLERRGRRDDAQVLRQLAPIERLEDVRAARRVLDAFVPQQRAAFWVIDRALEGQPAPRYVAGVVQLARSLNLGGVWAEMAALAERMVRAAPRPSGAFAFE
ncbi:MAG: hypothetical protein KAI24_26315 [Planctomycetes bacterium]|nr:hypothetical protein [Planctomycetota bacterium]